MDGGAGTGNGLVFPAGPLRAPLGSQIDRASTRLAMALVIAALIIGSSIVMTVGGGPTLFGLPAFGLVGWAGAVAGGLWLVRSIRRDHRQRDDDPWG